MRDAIADDAPTTWTTAALTEDLAAYYRREGWIVIREVTISAGGRADLLCMERTFSPKPLLVVEIKTSRADLLSDLRSEKWRRYTYCAAVTFAFPKGMAEVDEIPRDAGVMLRGPHGWERGRSVRWSKAPEPDAYMYRRLIFTIADEAVNGGKRLYGRPAIADDAPIRLEAAR